jgi:P22 coat protein - gene protein 5
MSNDLSSLTTGLTFFGREVLAQLQHKLVFVKAINSNYSGASAAPGSTVRVPDITISGDAADLAVGAQASASDVTSSYVDVTVGRIYKAVSFDNLEATLTNVDLRNQFASRLAYKVAAAADKKVANLFYLVGGEAGTADGTAALTTDLSKLSAARMILSQADCPMENLYCVINPTEASNMRSLTQVSAVYAAGTAETLRTGQLPPFYGFEMLESQQVDTATLATTAMWSTTPSINKTAGYAVGATSIVVDGLGTGTIPAGSGFSLGGHNYAVTEAAIIGGNAATLKIFPPLRAAAANNDVLTPYLHSAKGSMNLAFNKDAFIAVARVPTPFIGPGVGQVTVTDEQTGLSIRVAVESHVLADPGYVETISCDMVFGVNLVRPEYAVKLTGKV